MAEACFFKGSNSHLSCFYTTGGGLYTKSYGDGWGNARLVLKEARGSFTINPSGYKSSEFGSFYILCRDAKGGIHLVIEKKGEWESRFVFDTKAGSGAMAAAVSDKGDFNFLYNIPSHDGKSNILVSHRLGIKDPQSLDGLIFPPGCAFSAQHTSPSHMVAFYQTKNPEYSLCCREISTTQSGRRIELCMHRYPVSDFSALTADDAVYMLYISKTTFSNRLIFMKKEDEDFGAPIVLWEAPNIENCLLQIIKNRLYAFFTSNQTMYYCVSGASDFSVFNRPSGYTERISAVKKAAFVRQDGNSEKDFFAREVYIDADAPWEVQVLPDLCAEFYPPPTVSAFVQNPLKKSTAQSKTQPALQQPVQKETAIQQEALRQNTARNAEESLQIAQGKIMRLNRAISEKDKKIFALAGQIKQKNAEINSLIAEVAKLRDAEKNAVGNPRGVEDKFDEDETGTEISVAETWETERQKATEIQENQ